VLQRCRIKREHAHRNARWRSLHRHLHLPVYLYDGWTGWAGAALHDWGSPAPGPPAGRPGEMLLFISCPQ
jgi:hypothetical protein